MRLSALCAVLAAAWIFGMADTVAAQSRTQILARAGVWEAYYTPAGSSSIGKAICGLSQFSQSQPLLGFMLKAQEDADLVWIDLVKGNWGVPEHAQMRVALEVDGRPVWSGIFAGTDQSTLIRGNIGSIQEAKRVIFALAYGNSAKVVFLDGDEGAWRVPLSGSMRSATTWLQCITAVRQPQQTQPYASGGGAPASPSQPFSGRQSQPSSGGGFPQVPVPDATPVDTDPQKQ